MSTDLANSLNDLIDRNCAGLPAGKLESHDLASLARRILCPPDVAQQLIADGTLAPSGPVYGNDETGPQRFGSDDLNEIRRAVLTAILEAIIEESDGSPDEIRMAASDALSRHVRSFDPQPGEPTAFGRALGSGCVMLGRPEDDEPGPFQRAASTAGKVAAAGALGYGATALLRGRRLAPGAGIWGQLRAGNAANIATGRAALGSLSSGAEKVAAVLAGKRRLFD